MNKVYIYNDNRDTIFTSLLMNDLNDRGILFNNMHTTKVINTNNILIYIPKLGIADMESHDIVSHIANIEADILDFRFKIIPCIDYNDYTNIRRLFDAYFGKRNFKYYQSIDFNTLYSNIIADECDKLLYRYGKFHNR